MDVFEQEFLKPGKFPTPHGFAVLTADDIRGYVDGTRKLMADGWSAPILFEHPTAGTDEGSIRDAKADEVKHGAGWLKDVKVREDGTAVQVLEVADPKAAEQLRNGSIKFTSPELRPSFLGRYQPHISHIALTHKPRFTGQGPIQPVQLSLEHETLQLSLEDLMDDDKDTKGDDDKAPPKADDKPENPDAPEQDTGPDPQFQALVAQLKEVKQLDLPSDVTPDTLVRDLLTALKTAAAHEAKSKEADAADDADDDTAPEMTEDRPPALQFSIADVDAGKVTNKLLGKVIKQCHESLCGRLDSLAKDARITPGLQQKLSRGGAIQFSADADEVPSFTLGQVLDLLEEHTLPGQAWDQSQLEQLSVDEAPVKAGAELTPEQAKKIVDQQLKSGLKL